MIGGKPEPYCGAYATENGMERSVAYKGSPTMVGINSTLGMPKTSSSTLPGQQVVSRNRTSYPESFASHVYHLNSKFEHTSSWSAKSM